MKLRRPTDFLILQSLYLHGRNVATNLAELTGKSRKNINTRLPVLADYGLVERIGPAETSGLYQITALGERALEHADQYDEVDDFEALLERESSGPAVPELLLRRGRAAGESSEQPD